MLGVDSHFKVIELKVLQVLLEYVLIHISVFLY